VKAEIEKNSEDNNREKDTPLCLNCLRPVDPLYHYCPHCGRAVGQLTPIMPYESIRWQADIWGKIWQQVWSRDVTFMGRLFRLFMIIWNVPIMLVGLVPELWQKKKTKTPQNKHQSDVEVNPH